MRHGPCRRKTTPSTMRSPGRHRCPPPPRAHAGMPSGTHAQTAAAHARFQSDQAPNPRTAQIRALRERARHSDESLKQLSTLAKQSSSVIQVGVSGRGLSGRGLSGRGLSGRACLAAIGRPGRMDARPVALCGSAARSGRAPPPFPRMFHEMQHTPCTVQHVTYAAHHAIGPSAGRRVGLLRRHA